jgi:hypothetical protein
VLGRIGCTAHLRKLQREDNGIWPASLKVVAEGAKFVTPRMSWKPLCFLWSSGSLSCL